MRCIRWALASALAAALFAPLAALAEDADRRMELMEQRLLALEDRLAASQATIDQQADLLRAQAAPAVSQGTQVDSFLSGLEFGGHIKGSYLFNENSPQEGGTAQPLCQFNCRHNEFSFDSAKIEIGKAASEPGSVGFQFDVVYGQNADILRALSPDAPGGFFGASDFSLFVQQAYVSYNWNDIEFKFGNFETLLGWELIDSEDNNNITHGILFTWAIPLYHTGVLASGSFSEQIGWSLGVTNGFNNTFDTNDNKGVVGLVSFEEGGFFTSLSSYYGSDGGFTGSVGSSDDIWIFDYVASFEASDNLSFWLNVDYGDVEDSATAVPAGSGDSDYLGVAVGASFSLSERTSLAIRGEYWDDEDDVRGACGIGIESSDCELWSLTGTLSYKMTDNLLLRGEVRYDLADDDTATDGDIFPDDDAGQFEDSALYGIVEISYLFD